MSDYYFYDKKYKTKREKLNQISIFLDYLIKGIFSFLSKRVSYFDSLYFLDKPGSIWIKKYSLFIENLKFDKKDWIEESDDEFENNDVNIDENISIEKILFYEVLNIDELRRAKLKILKKYSNYSDYFINLSGYDILNEKIDKILNNYSGNSSGGLLYFEYPENNIGKYELIKSINVTYNKIGESFVVFTYEVKGSDLFNIYCSKIFSSKNEVLWKATKFKFKFTDFGVTHSDGGQSLGSIVNVSLRNLVSDLSFEVGGVLNKINGYFSKKRNFPQLIHFFKIQDHDNFERSYGINDFINDNDKLIFPMNFGTDTFDSLTYFEKHKDFEEVDRIDRSIKKSNIKNVGVLYAINFFVKRNLNDLIQYRSDFNNFFLKQSLWYYSVLPNYFYYVKLKLYSDKVTLFYERVFNDSNMYKFFISNLSEFLNEFKPGLDNILCNKENLRDYLKNDLYFSFKYFRKNLKLFKIVLNDFENINNYKTNYFLQLIIIFLTLITLYITFLNPNG